MGVRRIQIPVILGALAVVLAAGAACRDRRPIRVGFLGGLSGRHYDLGIAGRDAVELAFAEANAAGGVNGRTVELIARDDGQDPDVAGRAFGELVQAGAVAVIGPMTSSMAEAVLPLANREHVLLVSPTVSSPAFQHHDDWLVLLHPSSMDSAADLARHAAGRGVRRAVVFFDRSNAAFTEPYLRAFQDALRAAGGDVVRVQPFVSGQVTSYASLVGEALRAAGADAILVIANALDSATLFQQVRKIDARVGLYGTPWGLTRDVIAHGGAAVEGAIFGQYVDVDSRAPAYRAFAAAYDARFRRKVDFAAAVSYEAAQALLASLRRDATRDGVRRAILSLGPFPGLQGTLEIDRFGDTARRPQFVTIRSGRMEPVGPP